MVIVVLENLFKKRCTINITAPYRGSNTSKPYHNQYSMNMYVWTFHICFFFTHLNQNIYCKVLDSDPCDPWGNLLVYTKRPIMLLPSSRLIYRTPSAAILAENSRARFHSGWWWKILIVQNIIIKVVKNEKSQSWMITPPEILLNVVRP